MKRFKPDIEGVLTPEDPADTAKESPAIPENMVPLPHLILGTRIHVGLAFNYTGPLKIKFEKTRSGHYVEVLVPDFDSQEDDKE